jgi:hypothetical protein
MIFRQRNPEATEPAGMAGSDHTRESVCSHRHLKRFPNPVK